MSTSFDTTLNPQPKKISPCCRKASVSTFGYTKRNIGKQLLIVLAIFIVTISVAVVIPLAVGVSKTDVLSFKSSSLSILIFYIFYDLICVRFGEEDGKSKTALCFL